MPDFRATYPTNVTARCWRRYSRSSNELHRTALAIELSVQCTAAELLRTEARRRTEEELCMLMLGRLRNR